MRFEFLSCTCTCIIFLQTMKIEQNQNDENLKLLENISQRERQERLPTAQILSETLSALNVSIDALPQKCQQLLNKITTEAAMDTDLDPISLSLRHSRQLSTNVEEDYDILLLKQKNQELQMKIDRNKKVIESLRRDLVDAKASLASQNPNPGNIQENIRQLRQKVGSYEESCAKAKAKFTKLAVPDGLHPQPLSVLVSQLVTLRSEEAELSERADEVSFTKQCRQSLLRLRN